jgi:hypothetical protein
MLFRRVNQAVIGWGWGIFGFEGFKWFEEFEGSKWFEGLKVQGFKDSRVQSCSDASHYSSTLSPHWYGVTCRLKV